MSDRADGGIAHLSVPPGGAGRAVLIIHSWWGLTSSFTDFSDELASRGFLVGCADLFEQKAATTEAEARSLRRTKRREPAYRTLQRCVLSLTSHAHSCGAPPAVIGFSMGAHWAVWLAQHPGPRVHGAVLFYGARGGDYSAATGPVLAHFAAEDPFVTRSARRGMERAVRRSGLAYTAYDYPGTSHWFAEAAHPAFDRGAASLAFERTVGFLNGL